MAKIKVTLTKSTIGCKKDQIATVKALKVAEDVARLRGKTVEEILG